MRGVDVSYLLDCYDYKSMRGAQKNHYWRSQGMIVRETVYLTEVNIINKLSKPIRDHSATLEQKRGVHNPLILIAFFHLNWQFTLFCGPRKRSANCPWPNLNWFYIIHHFGDYDEAVNKQNTYIMWPMSGATWDCFFFMEHAVHTHPKNMHTR